MKRSTAFAAIALITFAATIHAQTTRKEVVLDTDKGGIELKVSVPDRMTGPTDFSGNEGIGGGGEITANGVTFYGKEASFGGRIGDTGNLLYHTTVSSTTSNASKFSNDKLAAEMLKNTGQEFSDAKRVETEYPILDNGINATYWVCSAVVFEKNSNKTACTKIETAVSKDSKKSSAIMVTAIELTNKFNQNPEKYKNGVEKMFNDVASNSKARLK